MKKLIILSVFSIIISSPLFSQESDTLYKPYEESKSKEYMTLFGHNKPRGAYGAFNIGYTRIADEQSVMFGGRFEWIAAQAIGFGFGGKGFINEYHYEPTIDRDVFLTGGFGGLYIEPIVMPRFPVHLAFPVLLGAGGISYISKDMDFNDNFIEDSEAFLIVEPTAELELNITRHFRLALGASYIFTTPFDIGSEGNPVASAKSMDGWNYTVTFKFGKF
ncbi:MAG TPA: hypothetical protein VMV47_05635 [Bacteroidales bacterium]|nr:hypothetical protein [Bacteroidales bacterium]